MITDTASKEFGRGQFGLRGHLELGVELIFWTSGLFLGGVQAYAARFRGGLDAVSYLDIADVYF
jgi:hypothetical protein